MNAKEVGQKLIELCEAGHFFEAIDTLYGEDVVSIEAAESPDFARETRGIEAIREKNRQWAAAHEIHSIRAEGPWPHYERVAVRWSMDVSRKSESGAGERMKFDEIALYTVADGKVVKEEFFYDA
jgi:ketosteroid isomerase-like protein